MSSSLQQIGTTRLGNNQSESGHLLPLAPSNVESRLADLRKNRLRTQPTMVGMAASLRTSPIPPTLYTTRATHATSSSGSLYSWTSAATPSVASVEDAARPAAVFSPSVYSQDGSSLKAPLPPALYLGSPLEPLSPDYILPSGENGRDMAYSPAASFLGRYRSTAKAAEQAKTTTDEGDDSDSSYARQLSRPVLPAGPQQLNNETDDNANTSGEEEHEHEQKERKHCSTERHRVHSPFPFAAAHTGSSEEPRTYSTSDKYSSSTETLPVTGINKKQQAQQSMRRPAALASERSYNANGYIAPRNSPVGSAEAVNIQNITLRTSASATTSQSDDKSSPGEQRPAHTERRRDDGSSSFHPASTSASKVASVTSKTTTTGRARRSTGLRRPTDEQLAARLRAASSPPPPSYSADPSSKSTGKRGIAQGARELHNPREPRPAGWDNPNDRVLDAVWMSRADWDMLLGIRHTMCQTFNEHLLNGPGVGRSMADSLDLAEHTQIVRGVWAREKEKADDRERAAERELELEQAAAAERAEARTRRGRVLGGIRGLRARIKNSVREGVPSILVSTSRIRPRDRGRDGHDDEEEARRLLPSVHVLGSLPDEMDWNYLQGRMNRQK